eukprot:GILK01004642.1.p1 GENE.GILK01004642.1~~GILK01004642.1.p1  ORF type:complete len:888 (-),score=198.96 GILK01004642.1:69-2519(-)
MAARTTAEPLTYTQIREQCRLNEIALQIFDPVDYPIRKPLGGKRFFAAHSAIPRAVEGKLKITGSQVESSRDAVVFITGYGSLSDEFAACSRCEGSNGDKKGCETCGMNVHIKINQFTLSGMPLGIGQDKIYDMDIKVRMGFNNVPFRVNQTSGLFIPGEVSTDNFKVYGKLDIQSDFPAISKVVSMLQSKILGWRPLDLTKTFAGIIPKQLPAILKGPLRHLLQQSSSNTAIHAALSLTTNEDGLATFSLQGDLDFVKPSSGLVSLTEPWKLEVLQPFLLEADHRLELKFDLAKKVGQVDMEIEAGLNVEANLHRVAASIRKPDQTTTGVTSSIGHRQAILSQLDSAQYRDALSPSPETKAEVQRLQRLLQSDLGEISDVSDGDTQTVNKGRNVSVLGSAMNSLTKAADVELNLNGSLNLRDGDIIISSYSDPTQDPDNVDAWAASRNGFSAVVPASMVPQWIGEGPLSTNLHLKDLGFAIEADLTSEQRNGSAYMNLQGKRLVLETSIEKGLMFKHGDKGVVSTVLESYEQKFVHAVGLHVPLQIRLNDGHLNLSIAPIVLKHIDTTLLVDSQLSKMGSTSSQAAQGELVSDLWSQCVANEQSLIRFKTDLLIARYAFNFSTSMDIRFSFDLNAFWEGVGNAAAWSNPLFDRLPADQRSAIEFNITAEKKSSEESAGKGFWGFFKNVKNTISNSLAKATLRGSRWAVIHCSYLMLFEKKQDKLTFDQAVPLDNFKSVNLLNATSGGPDDYLAIQLLTKDPAPGQYLRDWTLSLPVTPENRVLINQWMSQLQVIIDQNAIQIPSDSVVDSEEGFL